MPELVAPTTRLHTAWLAARDDWGPGVHEDGFGLLPADEVDSPTGFAAWVARLLGMDRVLVVCEAGNTASAKTIERQGGVLEEVQTTGLGVSWRYWIAL